METSVPMLPLSLNFPLVLLSIIALIFYHLYGKLSYWSKRGVPCVPLRIVFLQPFQMLLGRRSFWEILRAYCNELEGHTFGGCYLFCLHASLILLDPEIIRTCLVNSFSSFQNRMPPPDEEYDQLSGNLFQLAGEKWRQIRHKVSAAFSPAKLKIMHQSQKECAHELNAYMQKLCSETGGTEICVKDLMSSYTMDVIGACGLGIKSNVIQNPNCEFKRLVDLTLTFNLRKAVYSMLEVAHPRLPRIFGLKAVQQEVEQFYRSLVRETVEMKKKDVKSTRKDFLQILMNLRDGTEQNPNKSTDETAQEIELAKDLDGPIFTENTMVSLISSFLSIGFEPAASALTFCLYELALHPEIQAKIFQEIQEVKGECANGVNFEDMRKLTYMEQVIDETLRKYPVGAFLMRTCTKPFIIPDSTVVVEENVRIFIPILSLHHDPKYFPEPDKFDPERFSKDHRGKIVPGTYLPFGDGPRFCIANRLAIMIIKTMLITMVSNYTIHTCARTQDRIKFDKTRFMLRVEGALFLKIQKRKKKPLNLK